MTLKELRESLQKCCAEGNHIVHLDVSQVRKSGLWGKVPVVSIYITFFDEDQDQEIAVSGLLEVQCGEPEIKEQTPWYQKEGE